MESIEKPLGQLQHASAATKAETAALEEIADARIWMRSAGLHIPE